MNNKTVNIQSAQTHPESQQPSCDVCKIGNDQPNTNPSNHVKTVTAELKSHKLIGENNKEIRFETLYESNRAMVIFMRHFNCYVCRDFINQLIKQLNFQDFQKQNINFYVVGCSDYKGMQSFLKELPFPASHLLTDPSRISYKNLGLLQAKNFKELKGDGVMAKETTSSTFGGFTWTLWKSICSGNRGNVYQLGGCFLLEKKTGEVLFSSIDSSAVQHVSIEQIKELAREYGTNKD